MQALFHLFIRSFLILAQKCFQDIAFDENHFGVFQVFLHCLPPNPQEWENVVYQSRAQYETIKSKHICDPKMNDEKRDTSVENPLSQDDQVIVW